MISGLSFTGLFYGIGIFISGYYISRLIFLLFDIYLKPAKKLTDFGAGKGDWAVITGATDGIGKALATELAANKMNLILISRSESKLEETKKELQKDGILIKTIAVDFAQAKDSDWDLIKQTIKPLRTSILINSVGISHEFPKPFEEEDQERCDTIIELNIKALVNMTRIVVPKMKERKNGLIINMGSFVSLVPSPFLAMYSGSKSFVKSFSQAIGSELFPFGILVQHVNTYYVVSKMSKIRKPSFTTPLPDVYARSLLSHIGSGCGTIEPFTSVPFLSHALLSFVIENCFSRKFWLDIYHNMLQDVRKRALAKQARIAAEKEKTN
ncbi:hypothetical protein BB558_000229 [Smittium angustum]|uniref:Very-long-chain 3-oxoacyl-CoA reductase n=1 Tax=Smittium angustum TaxID=133377 RepID=A0A2U1JEN9_SMIAN|nr:hypothetical protein BB558_000229 [Smittium angustum]